MKTFILIVTLITAAFGSNLKAEVIERNGYYLSSQDLEKFTSSTPVDASLPAPTPVKTSSLDPVTGSLTAMASLIFILLLVAISASFYFLPTIVACRKRKRNAGAICILNLLTGWSFIGWVGALIWACTEDPKIVVEGPANLTVAA